jgi:hypothetical protein
MGELLRFATSDGEMIGTGRELLGSGDQVTWLDPPSGRDANDVLARDVGLDATYVGRRRLWRAGWIDLGRQALAGAVE